MYLFLFNCSETRALFEVNCELFRHENIQFATKISNVRMFIINSLQWALSIIISTLKVEKFCFSGVKRELYKKQAKKQDEEK